MFKGIKASDFRDTYFDMMLASSSGIFLIARGYPEDGNFVYIVIQRGDPQDYTYTFLDAAIDEYNKALKKKLS